MRKYRVNISPEFASCDMGLPKRVLIIKNFDHHHPIGYAVVKVENGEVIAESETDIDIPYTHYLDSVEIGGFIVKKEDGVVREFDLKCISLGMKCYPLKSMISSY